MRAKQIVYFSLVDLCICTKMFGDWQLYRIYKYACDKFIAQKFRILYSYVRPHAYSTFYWYFHHFNKTEEKIEEKRNTFEFPGALLHFLCRAGLDVSMCVRISPFQIRNTTHIFIQFNMIVLVYLNWIFTTNGVCARVYTLSLLHLDALALAHYRASRN